MSSGDEDEKTLCKYGVNCYQKNPEHHRRFKHPKRKAKDDTSNVEKKPKCEELDEKNTGEYTRLKKKPICEGLDEKAISKEEKSKTIPKHEGTNGKNLTDGAEEQKCEKVTKNEEKELKPEEESSTSHLSDNVSQFTNDIKLKISTLLLVNMPNDFFSFFDFCESLDKKKPKQALAAVGLYLVGPFDLINKDIESIDQSVVLRHYRYYYDPPEFQTVLRSDDKNLLHYGYYRDIPEEEPVFVASNEAEVGCTLNIISDNLFSAANIHIDKIKKIADPFKKMKIQKIQNSLVDWSKTNKFTLASLTKKMRERRTKVVAKTFHGAGIVVPFNKKTELGYRELKEDNNTLKKMFNKIVEAETEEDKKLHWGKLQPVITYASIANDECDFGTGLELGLDLFCFGHEILHKAVAQVLTTSYNLLGRNNFATILTLHLKDRKKGGEVCTIAL